MKTVAVLQARMGSSRLPGKVMKQVAGEPLLALMLQRLSRSTEIDRLVVATTDQPRDRLLLDLAARHGCGGFGGSETDVLDRYYQAARAEGADIVVRMTGDCPLMDAAVVDDVIRRFKAARVDYASNAEPPSFPNGLDVEVFSFAALDRVWREASSAYDREHVTPYLRGSDSFLRLSVLNDEDLSALRWTVDEAADLEVVRNVFVHFAPDVLFGWRDILDLYRARPELFAANRGIPRNQGSVLGPGQKLWKRAAALIPGGAMMAAKRSEAFLADQWPAYFARAQGCRVWDVGGRAYVDMCMTGGASPLGYGHPEVDAAARGAIELGIVSTLNAPEDVQLAERLIELHPWADMARLARSDDEARAIADRIARAASGPGAIAVCGGSPRGFCAEDGPGRAVALACNDFEGLSQLARDHRLAAISVDLAVGPERDFLEQARELATVQGAVLIFDECRSGFRNTFGGLHSTLGVEPDLAVFGSAIGNGFAIAAVVGRRATMSAAEDLFDGNPSWTERIGPSAALKTLQVMERLRSWDRITTAATVIARRWETLARKHSLAIRTGGSSSAPSLAFRGPNASAYQALITQEMLEKGYLAGDAVCVCTEHTPPVVDAYFEVLDGVFALIRSCEDGRPLSELLKGPILPAAAQTSGG